MLPQGLDKVAALITVIRVGDLLDRLWPADKIVTTFHNGILHKLDADEVLFQVAAVVEFLSGNPKWDDLLETWELFNG